MSPGPPGPPQTLRFDVTAEDVIAAYVDQLMRADASRAALRTARTSILSAGAVVALLGAAAPQASALFVGAVLLGTAAGVAGYPAVFRRAGRRRIQAAVSHSPPPGLIGPTRVTVGEGGLVFEPPSGGPETIPWATLELRVTPEHLLVTAGDAGAAPRPIPSRAFPTAEARARFIEALRAAMG